MNTLYEVLEVSEKASNEIIEKSYKVLAKKYHPDLQTPENRKMAEEKMKKINEAYDILSDTIKRKEYDEKLEIEREKKEQVNKYNEYNKQTINVNQQNNIHNNMNNNMQNQFNQNNYYNERMQQAKYEAELRKQQEEMRRQMEAKMQQDYQNAYYNYLRSLGYRIKEKWTWKKTKTLILILLVLSGIGTALWFIPPTHNILINFYESNKLVKIIVDVIAGIIIALFKTIKSMLTGE